MNGAEGLEVPVHRSLVEPILIAGIPRSVALVLWVTTGAIGLGLQQLWILAVAIPLHALLAAISKPDPYALEIFFKEIFRQVRSPERFDP
jgi:type IV secretion system protein TrbD